VHHVLPCIAFSISSISTTQRPSASITVSALRKVASDSPTNLLLRSGPEIFPYPILEVGANGIDPNRVTSDVNAPVRDRLRLHHLVHFSIAKCQWLRAGGRDEGGHSAGVALALAAGGRLGRVDLPLVAMDCALAGALFDCDLGYPLCLPPRPISGCSVTHSDTRKRLVLQLMPIESGFLCCPAYNPILCAGHLGGFHRRAPISQPPHSSNTANSANASASVLPQP
jgi:hypothetical protein